MALSAKHKKILGYIKSNKIELEEICEKAGVDDVELYELLAGTGSRANQEFTQALQEADKLVEDRTNRRALQAKEYLYKRLLNWVKHNDAADMNTSSRHKMMVDAINALTKAQPTINIEQHMWKIGMNPEEAANEFRRLKGLAGQATVRGRVSKSSSKGAEPLSVLDGSDDEDAEVKQIAPLRAKSETEGFSRKPSDSKGDFWRQ